MSTTIIRVIAKVGIAIGAVGITLLTCSLVVGHFGPIQAIDVLINLVVICAGLWVLNQAR